MQPFWCRSFTSVLLVSQSVSLAFSEEKVNTDGFAMDTSVYPENASKPVLKTTTVFQGRRAYDVLHGAPSRIACFDFEAKMIFLLEPQRRKRTTISFSDVLLFQSELRKRATRHEGLAAFLAAPTFIREFDANKSTVKLSSPWLTYEAKGRAASYDEVTRFVEFADWAARLGGMLSPAAPPANARIELNNALKRLNWLVEQVTRSGGPQAKTLGIIRSEHQHRNELSENDLALIQEVKKNLKDFDQVSFSEFRNLRNSAGEITKK